MHKIFLLQKFIKKERNIKYLYIIYRPKIPLYVIVELYN